MDKKVYRISYNFDGKDSYYLAKIDGEYIMKYDPKEALKMSSIQEAIEVLKDSKTYGVLEIVENLDKDVVSGKTRQIDYLSIDKKLKLKVNNISKKDIDLLFSNDRININFRNFKKVNRNRDKVISIINHRINQLIDFHDTLDKSYTKKKIGNDTSIVCEGCEICKEINRLSELLNSPFLKRDLLLTGEGVNRLVIDGYSISKYDSKTIFILMHDFPKLIRKEKDLTPTQVGIKYYGANESTMKTILSKIRKDESLHKLLADKRPKKN